MKNILVLYPSWESRSYGGFLRDLEKTNYTNTIIIRNMTNHYDETEKQIEKISKKCLEEGIDLAYIDINNDLIQNWKTIDKEISSIVCKDDQITMDITTMSRNVVWSILYFIRVRIKTVNIVYHQPESYKNEWISREPEQPRLLFKHSGIYDLTKKTTLIIVTGFDEERTKYMLYKYEPKKVYLLIQEGEQFNNIERNNESIHRLVCEEFGLNKDCIISRSIDSYSADFGFTILDSIIEVEYYSNIILASFGPKPSAIAAYKCYMKHPEMALCYLPCKEYNIDYCQGIGESLYYTLEFPMEDA